MERSRAQNLVLVAGAALLFLGLWGLYQYSNPPGPDALPLILGGPRHGVELKSLPNIKPNQVVYLNYWAEWCEPCLDEIPDLLRLSESFMPGSWTLVLAHRGPMNERALSLKRQWQSQSKSINAIWVLESDLPYGENPPVLPYHQVFDRQGLLVHESYGAIKERLPNLMQLIQNLVQSESQPSK